jgi:hypothetical protein
MHTLLLVIRYLFLALAIWASVVCMFWLLLVTWGGFVRITTLVGLGQLVCSVLVWVSYVAMIALWWFRFRSRQFPASKLKFAWACVAAGAVGSTSIDVYIAMNPDPFFGTGLPTFFLWPVAAFGIAALASPPLPNRGVQPTPAGGAANAGR